MGGVEPLLLSGAVVHLLRQGAKDLFCGCLVDKIAGPPFAEDGERGCGVGDADEAIETEEDFMHSTDETSVGMGIETGE